MVTPLIPLYYTNIVQHLSNSRSTTLFALDTRSGKEVCIKYVRTFYFLDPHTNTEICFDNPINEERILRQIRIVSEENQKRDVNDPLRYNPLLDDYFMKLVEYLHFPEQKYVLLVTERAQGKDLFSCFEELPYVKLSSNFTVHQMWSDEDRVFLTMEVLKIVYHLHVHHGISHSDLSLENFIYDRLNKKLVLIDFGAATPHRTFSHVVGKNQYMSREAIRYSNRAVNACPYSSQANDMHSLGILFFIFRFGTIAFGQASYTNDENYRYIVNFKKFIHRTCVERQKHYCMTEDEETFFHDWLTSYEKRRPTLEDIYRSNYFQKIWTEYDVLYQEETLSYDDAEKEKEEEKDMGNQPMVLC